MTAPHQAFAGRYPRRSGLYGPTAILSRSDIANGNGAPRVMSDLKVPTYKRQPLPVVDGRSPVGPLRSDIPVGRAFMVRQLFFREATLQTATVHHASCRT
jgi:hypothetical protein